MASEEDLMRQMMGFSGFGSNKITQEKNILAAKLAESKREESKRIHPTKQETAKSTHSDSKGVDDDEEEEDDEVIGPLPVFEQSVDAEKSKQSTKSTNHDTKADDSSENSDSEDEEDTIVDRIPQSHEITLNHGNKALSALALDPSGSRLATGGMDFDLKFWDFNSMDVHLNAFRTLQPAEGHWINSLQFSLTGDKVVIGAGNAQPQVLDRDGHQIYECKKGDQYIVDMKNTKGHVAMVRAACFDPKNRDHFASCGDDGTIRLWDINIVKKNQEVIRLKTRQNKKTPCTYCCFNKDGKLIVGAGQDGSIQAWDTRRMFVNTTYKVMDAHVNGSEISCLCVAADGRTIVSRAGDDTVKLWDFRNFRKPIHTANNLVSYYSTTKCVFSPDEKLILTGTSVKKGKGAGNLVFLDKQNLEKVLEIPFQDLSVVSVLWHSRINQIFAGLSDGTVKVLFDPEKSKNGATLCVGKVKTKRFDPGENMLKPQIINPHALKMYREKRAESMKKVKAKLRADPVASHKPDAPLATGHGVGGRLKEGMSLTGFVVRNIALAKKDDTNPREALLKHAEAAKNDPFWIAPAYSATQPKAIFKTDSDSEDDNEDDGQVSMASAPKRSKQE